MVLDKLGEEIQELGSLVILLLLKSRRVLVGPSAQRRRDYVSINYCCLVIHLKLNGYKKNDLSFVINLQVGWMVLLLVLLGTFLWLWSDYDWKSRLVQDGLTHVWLLGWQWAKASLFSIGPLFLEQDWLLYISVSQSRVPRGQVPRYKCLLNP